MYVSFLYFHSQCLILYLWPLLPYVSILFVQLLSWCQRPHTILALIYIYIETHMLSITQGMQFVNLSPTIYSNANTNSLCKYRGYNSVHPWQLMFPCLTSHICGAIARYQWQLFITLWYYLSFSDAWWYTRFHRGAHHFLKKWRSCHKLLSAVIAILTWKHLGTILIYSILSFHFIWNTWDISTPPWIVTWFH